MYFFCSQLHGLATREISLLIGTLLKKLEETGITSVVGLQVPLHPPEYNFKYNISGDIINWMATTWYQLESHSFCNLILRNSLSFPWALLFSNNKFPEFSKFSLSVVNPGINFWKGRNPAKLLNNIFEFDLETD